MTIASTVAPVTRIRSAGAVAVMCVILAGCAGHVGESASDATVASTPRSLAAATAHFVGGTATFARSTQSIASFPRGAYGADVSIALNGQKIHVTTVVSRTIAKDQSRRCDNDVYSGCTVSSVDGNRLVVRWQLWEPEEDPGVVDVSSFRDHEVVTVLYYGPDLKRSPLKGGLPFDEKKLEELASSPVVGLLTSPDLVRDGKALDVWH